MENYTAWKTILIIEESVHYNNTFLKALDCQNTLFKFIEEERKFLIILQNLK